MTLMVTVPIMAMTGKYKVDLPGAHTMESRDEGALIITVLPYEDEETGKRGLAVAVAETDCGVFTGEEDDNTFEKALNLLKEKIEEDPERMVMIRADKMVKHGIVIDLLRTSKLFGAQTIAVACMQKGV
jgi:biopolymer transport protein ExbD